MITSFKIFESYDSIIEDSYNDYMLSQTDEERRVMARHIRRTALGDIANRGGKLSDWLDRFKDEKIVLDEFPKIIISPEDPYGEEQWEQ